MKRTHCATVFALALLTTGCAQADNKPLPATISELDLSRFEGKWFELARIPIPIARDWVNTCDIYSKNANGTWSVRYEGNKGTDAGPRKVLKQKLRIPDIASPGDMEVSFIPFIWMKYRLLYMSEDYRYMLVGSSSMDLLWIMSRDARPTDAAYLTLVEKAASLGYEVSRLERVSQSGK